MPHTALFAITISRISCTNSSDGGWPSSGESVSLAACTPAHRMSSDTTKPHQPSICQCRKCPASVESSTAAVAAQSDRLSAAVACMAAALIFFPTPRL